MKLTYPGPHEGVTVLALGQKVKRDETIDVDDDALAAQLVDQGWKPAKTPAKKAAPTTTAPEATDKEKP